MTPSFLQELVRHFPENSVKFLLQNGANTHDLLTLVEEPAADLDFTRLTVERTHFVQPDFEHVLADLLLKVPVRGGPADCSVCIYILIEHAVKPRRFTMLQLGEYLWEVYKMQKRTWDEHHTSDAKLLLQPVIPVLFYTGSRSWAEVPRMRELIRDGTRFGSLIPDFKPHLLNLRECPAETLKSRGGFFGQVLYLMQQRQAPLPEFRRVLQEVLTELEKMPATERQRWLEFLSFIYALVYHARRPEEQETCREAIEDVVKTGPHSKESQAMPKTIADMFKEEGERRGVLLAHQGTLVRQMKKRFKKIPRKVEARIRATTDVPLLETWLDNVLEAKTLAEVGVPLD